MLISGQKIGSVYDSGTWEGQITIAFQPGIHIFPLCLFTLFPPGVYILKTY